LGRKTIDIAFVNKRLAVFVDGCFWHGCPICYKPPKSNRRYWALKIKKNKARDAETNRELRADGWVVIRLWEHDVRSNADELAMIIQKKLSNYSLHP
jgi:DNA mismatch endonuclease (patch repair protein)